MLVRYQDEIADICDSADKQLAIEEKLREIDQQWTERMFEFGTWKARYHAIYLQWVGIRAVVTVIV